ncbi:uncharacterized protein FMAN_14453 [Fusarium mangiferae]|uniref:Uncharacterized protein n=1 Tax=Fusarium mangiferae TaxID=192010 RepID=A0A1L7UGU3_FUSMA|nr:uncharacterized protein FMAN_14453 [Fusarium mangiferae]CVL07573.1 uncharacterized protein FMAN_14453 [Fusarium mangiferae]
MAARCPEFLSLTLDPSTLTQRHSIQEIAEELFRYRYTCDASITFVATAQMLQYPDTYNHMLGFRCMALAKLRNFLLRPELSHMTDDMLCASVVNMTLLALSDLFGTGDGDAAFSHCSALLQIMSGMDYQSSSRMMTRMPFFSRLAIETAIFGTSTLAIFQENPDCRMWPSAWERLEKLYACETHHACGDIDASPLLRGHPDLFFLLLKLVELSRVQDPVERGGRLSVIEHRLLTLKRDNFHIYGRNADGEATHLWGIIWEHVISVLGIYVTSLRNPNYCSRSPQISKQVKAALPALKLIWGLQNDKSIAWKLPFAALDVGIVRNVGVQTFLMIVVCAVDDIEDLELLVRRFYQGKAFISEAYFQKLQQVIQTVRRRKLDNYEICTGNATLPCNGKHDGLDILRLKS